MSMQICFSVRLGGKGLAFLSPLDCGALQVFKKKKNKKEFSASTRTIIFCQSSLRLYGLEGMLTFIQVRTVLPFKSPFFSSALEVESNCGLPSGLSSTSCGR